MRILVASDGSEYAREAAWSAAVFGKPASASMVLLGVVERGESESDLRSKLEILRQEIAGDGGFSCEVAVRHGDAAEQILAETHEHFYHLVAIGVYGLSNQRRRIMGRTSRRIIRHIDVPLLVVSLGRRAINRVLICTSGEKPGETDAFVGGALAALVDAQVTVLHVMSQIPLAPEARIEDLERDVTELMQSGTREGRHLQRLLDILAEQGISRDRLSARVRHGLVVDEIISEVREGNYDLVVIGAHEVPPDQPWARLRVMLQEDIAGNILKHTRRPVLVVRAPGEGGWNIRQVEVADEQS